MTRRRTGAALIAATMLLAAACGGNSEADETTTVAPGPTAPDTTAATPTATAGTVAVETTRQESKEPERTTTTETRPPITGDFPKQNATVESAYPRVPLVGHVLGQGELAPDRPALVVKIDNASVAIPQSGLNEADVVFEEIVEYGITRFAAVFHSQSADPVGPIRSGRTQDVDMLSALNQPLFAWSGGNAGVTQAIEDSDLVNLNALHTPGYYRSGDRGAPHNLYSNTDALWSLAPPDAPAPGGLFRYLDPGEELGDGLDVSSGAGAEMAVGSYRARWEWSPETARYLRVQNGSAHQTTNSGQVNTQNLVILKMAYLPSPVDARSPEAQTLGEGPAWVLSEGKVIAGHWVREARTDMFFLFQGVGPDAKPIKLAPGRTFVELMDRTAPDPTIL